MGSPLGSVGYVRQWGICKAVGGVRQWGVRSMVEGPLGSRGSVRQ